MTLGDCKQSRSWTRDWIETVGFVDVELRKPVATERGRVASTALGAHTAADDRNEAWRGLRLISQASPSGHRTGGRPAYGGWNGRRACGYFSGSGVIQATRPRPTWRETFRTWNHQRSQRLSQSNRLRYISRASETVSATDPPFHSQQEETGEKTVASFGTPTKKGHRNKKKVVP